MADAIEVQGLRKAYGSYEAVRGIDLTVAEGEIFGFLGTNGAGKTTTIEILEGYRKRTAGEVRVLGVDPEHPTRAWRNRLGLVLQESEPDPLLTVRETLRLYAAFYEAPKRVDETIDLVGLAEKRTARVGTLSGGQRRRVDVAVALIGDPDLIFLDEPTTGFDPSARRESWTVIEGLKALGKTVFLTTHYLDEAQHLSDRLAILRAGEIVAHGRLDEVGVAAESGHTIIRLRLPAGVAAERVGTETGREVDAEGNELSLRTDEPQRDLYRLLSWAEREGVVLEGLEVRPPSLEDIFLDLTRDGDRPGG